jgi:hypothetical protein
MSSINPRKPLQHHKKIFAIFRLNGSEKTCLLKFKIIDVGDNFMGANVRKAEILI